MLSLNMVLLCCLIFHYTMSVVLYITYQCFSSLLKFMCLILCLFLKRGPRILPNHSYPYTVLQFSRYHATFTQV